MKKRFAIGRTMVLSLAATALTTPGFVLAGPGCMNDPRMARAYYPHSPMGPQTAYRPTAPYAYRSAPATYPMWIPAPYNRPVTAWRSNPAVTARPATAAPVEQNVAATVRTAVSSDNTPAAETVTVRISGMRFEPANLTVKPGTTVTWVQGDRMPHTITGKTKGLRSNTLGTGQKYSYTFTEAGSYDYSCGIHPSMKGRVIVGESGKDT